MTISLSTAALASTIVVLRLMQDWAFKLALFVERRQRPDAAETACKTPVMSAAYEQVQGSLRRRYAAVAGTPCNPAYAETAMRQRRQGQIHLDRRRWRRQQRDVYVHARFGMALNGAVTAQLAAGARRRCGTCPSFSDLFFPVVL